MPADPSDPLLTAATVMAAEPDRGAAAVDGGAQLVGCRLGPWLVEGLIGRGGMGVVFEATRADGAFALRAAIKLLKRGLDSEAILSRFLRERHILARLSHPNIARILDAGIAPDGRPWLAMEHVDGSTLGDYVRDQSIDTPGLLRLMLTVCDAVQAAHRQRIIHRDLKPSNLMVTRDGQIKLLDFGIAKLIDETEIDATRLAGEGSALTPAYAAPEQLLGQPLSPATDVHALGAMFYQLLTGQLPYRRDGLDGRALAQSVERETLIAPSAVLRQRRGLTGEAQRQERLRQIGGDLDRIVLKALHREPARRYADAQALADDLRRLLEHRPVLARPDSFAYRGSRFIRRNRLLAGAVGIAFAALSIGLAVALAQAHQAQLARERAESLVSFMLGDLHDRLIGVGRLDVLDAVSDRTLAYFASLGLADSSDDDLLARARALQQIAEVRQRLGKLPQAIDAAGEALAIREQLLARHPDDAEVIGALAESQSGLGYLYLDSGQQQAADAIYQAGRRTVERLLTRQPEAATSIDHLAIAEGNLAYAARARGDYAEGLPHALASIAADRRLIALEPGKTERVANLVADLGRVLEALEGLGRLAEAQVYQREAAGLARGLMQAEPDNKAHGARLLNMLSLCVRVALPDDPPAATLGCTEEMLSLANQLASHDPANLQWQQWRGRALRARGQLLVQAGRKAEAQRDLEAAVASFRSIHERQPEQLDYRGQYSDALSGLAEFHQLERRPAVAGGLVQQALALWREVVPTSEFGQLSKVNALLQAWHLDADAAPGRYREPALAVLAGRGAMSRDPSYQRYWAMAAYLQGDIAGGEAIARSIHAAGYRSPYFEHFRAVICGRLPAAGPARCTPLDEARASRTPGAETGPGTRPAAPG